MKNLLSLSFAVIGTFIWFTYVNSPQFTHGFSEMENEKSNEIFWLILGYWAMIVGVILGIFVRALLKLQDGGTTEIKIIDFMKSSWKRPDLWASIFTSPIIYGTIIKDSTLKEIPFLFFALQTGFTSYMLIKSFFIEKNP